MINDQTGLEALAGFVVLRRRAAGRSRIRRTPVNRLKPRIQIVNQLGNCLTGWQLVQDGQDQGRRMLSIVEESLIGGAHVRRRAERLARAVVAQPARMRPAGDD